MKTNKSLLFLLILCLLLGGCTKQTTVDIKSEYLNTTAASTEENVNTTTSYLGDFQIEFSIDAQIDFSRNRDIYWEYRGDHFGELKVEVRDVVQKGDVLMTVDVNVSEADLLSRELSVSEAMASLSTLDTSYYNQINQKSASMTGLTGDALKKAKYELARMQNEYAARRYSAAYRVAQAEKALKELTDHQAKTEILAPYDGVVVYVTRSFRTGDEIPTDSVLIRVADLSSRMMTLTNLTSTYNIPYLSTVTLTDMRDQKQYSGTVVSSRDVTGDSQDKVVIIPDIPVDSMALTGAVRVTGTMLSVKNVVMIDSRAIRQEGSKRYVLVLVNGAVSKIYVTVGGSNTTQTWITEGLSEGQTVVLP